MKGIFGWFRDSSKMKRWIMLILVGVVFVSFGMSNIIVSTDAITFIYAAKVILSFVLGFTCVILGIVYLNKRTMELFIESTDDRMQNDDKKVNVNSLIFNKKIYDGGPKVVVIGGGSGLNTLVEGLKKYTSNITAIVTVSDYGETLTKDNEKMKYLQLEDIKNGMAALSLHDESKMLELLNYRFKDGQLKNIAFSDLYFEAISDISNGLAEAIKNSNEIFKIYGKVLPITEDKMKICAELGNGYVVEEKARIASMVYDKITKISRVYLNPSNCKPTPGVVEAIQDADCIIMGPGSLYANIIPNLLVNGVVRTIKESKAKKIYVCNIMTEPGLTDNYSVADHINAIEEHCGAGLIDYCLYDTGEIVPEIIKKYNRDGADLVEQSIENVSDKKIKFIKENLSIIADDNCVRHNATLIADIVIQMICDDLKYKDKQNEPEYVMMNTKLRADKKINKEQKRNARRSKHEDRMIKEKGKKSKFADKYSERIQSIKNTDINAEKRKKVVSEKIADRRKKKKSFDEELNEIQNENTSEIKIKNYEQIRKEMLEKFNNSKMRK